MKRTFNILSLIIISLTLISGCGAWKDFDKPHPQEWEHWKKPGYSQDEVRKFLFQGCGYHHGIKRKNIIETEKCMLENGFVFHDIKYGRFYTCDHQINQDLPSCQSIRSNKKE